MKTTTNIIYSALALFAFACFAVSPQARATCQDACLTNNNTVQGDNALINNTGTGETAIGANALQNNTTGLYNTAVGFNALQINTTGYGNTANGFEALQINTTGNNNVANGDNALNRNTMGNLNTGNGARALERNSTGTGNTADGAQALVNTTGEFNTALGYQAGLNLTTGSNNIDIGALGTAGEANTIRIGKPGTQTRTFITAIRGVTVPSGVGVIVGSNNQLGTVVSSARFKEAIKPMDKASEAILALKPVTFRYKKELDPEGIRQFGLVAEDVEKVDADLVARDADGKVNTVRYEAVNAMLLNEFLKEHRKNEEQEATIARLRQNFAKQQKQIDALTAGLQKVSAQLELNKRAPQTVLNNQ